MVTPGVGRPPPPSDAIAQSAKNVVFCIFLILRFCEQANEGIVASIPFPPSTLATLLLYSEIFVCLCVNN